MLFIFSSPWLRSASLARWRAGIGLLLAAGWAQAGVLGPFLEGPHASPPPLQRYALPAVALQGADGVVRPLATVLDDGRPTVLTFMYSSCATVCPITNQTLVQFETLLGPERPRVNTVSISIDPTHDSVVKLAELAKRTGAQGAFYTGDPGASEAVQRAFNVWRGGDKMNHTPVFLLRAPGAAGWVRLDGLVTPRS